MEEQRFWPRPLPLMPAKAGIQFLGLGPRFRGDERTNQLNNSFSLYRMIFPDPVRGISLMTCTALGTL